MKWDELNNINFTNDLDSNSEKACLLDVRSESEWSQTGVLKNSKLCELLNLKTCQDLESYSTYYIYCSNGGRANLAYCFLKLDKKIDNVLIVNAKFNELYNP